MIYLSAFIITIILIIIFSYFSTNLNLVDFPSKRKLHNGLVPLVGGIAIYLSFIVFLPFINVDYQIFIIIISSSVVLILGVLDDAFELGVTIRLIAQLISGLLVLGSGLSIIDIGQYSYFSPIKLGAFGILLTMVSVIGLTNAINFVDGIDGLCSGLVLVALTTLFCFIYFSGNNVDLLIIKVLSSILVAFFIINVGLIPIKKVFLGDAGSMVLGFLLSWMLIYFSHPSTRSIHPVLTIWCVSIPVFDLMSVIIRRILRRINPFTPDRRHIHHILIDLGLAQTKVLLLILSLSILLSCIGGIIFFIYGSFEALISYFVLFIIYLYVSLLLSRRLSIKS